MKILSVVVTLIGAAAMLLAVVNIFAHTHILRITGAGYLRGATALFLLSLVIMVYDKIYGSKK